MRGKDNDAARHPTFDVHHHISNLLIPVRLVVQSVYVICALNSENESAFVNIILMFSFASLTTIHMPIARPKIACLHLLPGQSLSTLLHPSTKLESNF